MRQLTRLLRYVVPYWWQLLSSILLMAAVGLLDAFRVLLIGPIFDRVLNPGFPRARDAAVQGSLQRQYGVPAAICSFTLSQSLDGGRLCAGRRDSVEGYFRLRRARTW